MLLKSEAWKIMGDKPISRAELNQIIDVLSFAPWLNTREQIERRAAAIICRSSPNPKWSQNA